MKHTLRFSPSGPIRCLYTEKIDLASLGRLSVVRASEIIFNRENQQWDTLDARTGQRLFSHPSRDECVRWEHEHLQAGTSAFDQQIIHPSNP
ncbi:hypothetical protein [Roseibacillus ishigakijimensis]|uniref:Uncharacterized protein n=1 Tax=Roseibacillus ishigakijimensis TaxID=454146 RepID=A0A934VP16_9BACT|nr:hypothetical protein [Roseibacillus ishigakijimensis]MBK1835636.1 hypothetical protein [Roseibacillus ishigakijimensis]